MNKRQERVLKVLKNLNTYLYQKSGSAAWYIWHPEHYYVRLKLTCKDVYGLNLFFSHWTRHHSLG